MGIKKIKRHSVSEEVLEEFKRLISSGEWKAGEKIPSENELAAAMGVSRVSIRSALEQIKSLGLLVSRQGEGTFVCQIDGGQYMKALMPMVMLEPANQKYVLELRRVLECEQAALAAQRAEKADIEALRKNISQMQQMQMDAQAVAEQDLEFHMLLAKACKNPLMIQTSQILKDVIRGNIQLSAGKIDIDLTLEYHKEILRAIENREPQKARQIMAEHLDRVEQMIDGET